jgi:ribosomal-protein-alanine N-acetyltransferase
VTRASVGIGPMRAEDVASVGVIARASLPEAWTEAGLAAELGKPTALALVLRDDARVVAFAFASIVVDEAEIVTLAVDPEARRRGVGRALVRALVVGARARGARTAHLEVRAGNAAAIALYASLGFREVGVRPRYYADGEDALLMASVLAT